jgi:hypothetical protein
MIYLVGIGDTFGSDFKLASGTLEGEATALVHFAKLIGGDNPTESSSYSGWYLFVESSANGTISDYHLSNFHK